MFTIKIKVTQIEIRICPKSYKHHPLGRCLLSFHRSIGVRLNFTKMWELIRKFNDIQTTCKNRKYEGFSRNLLHFSKNIWKSYFPLLQLLIKELSH